MNSEKKQVTCKYRKQRTPIQLSEHFGYKKLLRFSFPTIVMMIFTSVYSIVDGFFVSNFAGKTPFAAVNFIMPFLIILGSVGFMFGTGGGALIAKTMGEGKTKRANELFSLMVYASIVCGIVIMILGMLILRPIAIRMGGSGKLLENSVFYGRIILVALPFYILQFLFQCLFATAEKPKLGLYVTIASGAANMVLDALFVAGFRWGLAGAAAATAFSQFIGGIVPIIYFGRKNSSRLQLIKCKFDGRALIKASTNGSSEFINQISASIVGILYNVQLMKYAGENGIAAYGVVMYVSMIFQAIFIGYTLGCAPVISYHYGARNHEELKNLRKKSTCVIGIFAVLMLIAGQVLARPFSLAFVSYDAKLLALTVHAFTIFSFSFLPSGFVIFASSFFTALNDGLTSAIISSLRTLAFQCIMVMVFPLLWGLDGIWWSVVAAETMAVVVAALFLVGKRQKYQY